MARVMVELGFGDNTKGHDASLAKIHDEDDVPLSDQDAGRSRRLGAIVNYLATDRPDSQLTASVLGRATAKTTENSWGNLKQVARYLKGHSKVVYEFPEV